MNSTDIKIQDQGKAKNETYKLKDLFRVIISKEAKAVLDDLLKRANEGFEAGEITKSDIVNSLLLGAPKYFTDAEVKALRAQHFDETKVLSSLLKGIAQGGALPENLKALLRVQYGLAENPRKKPSVSAASKAETVNLAGAEYDSR